MGVANPKSFHVELASLPKPKSLDRTTSIYPNIDILIQYRNTVLAFGCIDTMDEQFSKSNYNKLVCVTLIDFIYHFLTNTTKENIISSDMQYYHLIVSHISNRTMKFIVRVEQGT